MNRPWHIWSIFGVCLTVLLAAMGWVSLTVMRLDRAQQEAAQQAEVEERVRLALWRMDSALATFVVEESARPYYAYDAFHAAERAYTKGLGSFKQGDVVVPSPLLTYLPTNVLVHFQFNEDGSLTSPQVPLGAQRTLAGGTYTTAQKIEAAAARLRQFQLLLNQQAGPNAHEVASSLSRALGSSSASTAAFNNRDVLVNVCAAIPTNTVTQIRLAAEPDQQQKSQVSQLPSFGGMNQAVQQAEFQNPMSQMLRNSAEWNARTNLVGNWANNGDNMQSARNYLSASSPGVSEGPFKAAWLGSELVLARRVMVNGRALIQGCWLDWEKLRASLVGSVSDLFPAGNLQPLSVAVSDKDSRRLAALPARLVTGPAAAEAIPFWSPIRFSLVIAWSCVLLAAIAVALLLNGAVSLSERRGDFVSAVTHELRTPLTTFKMYSEMLAEGMVPEETKRQHYLTTLCSEANRLSHLVENVLAYARLERGSARSRVERVTLETLIERVRSRLAERAEQAGLALVIDSEAEALKTTVHIDVSAVEQILFNLVDNACKYAAPSASQKVIHLEAFPSGRFAMLRVRDHGQGITREGARRLFRPFSKSAHEAAHTAPGVGLGLALCRRLSRSMGGDLRLDELVKDGACFVLTLPAGSAAICPGPRPG